MKYQHYAPRCFFVLFFVLLFAHYFIVFPPLLSFCFFFFFFNDPAPPEIYPLPLPAALPIYAGIERDPPPRDGAGETPDRRREPRGQAAPPRRCSTQRARAREQTAQTRRARPGDRSPEVLHQRAHDPLRASSAHVSGDDGSDRDLEAIPGARNTRTIPPRPRTPVREHGGERTPNTDRIGPPVEHRVKAIDRRPQAGKAGEMQTHVKAVLVTSPPHHQPPMGPVQRNRPPVLLPPNASPP